MFVPLFLIDNSYVAPILENLFDKRSIFNMSHWTKADIQRIKVTQLEFTCSKSTIETLEKGVNNVQS